MLCLHCISYVDRRIGGSADPPGIGMWYVDSKGKIKTRRGTSQVESYHSQYHHSFPATHYSLPLFLKRRSSFNHNWNVRAGIANSGEYDWGTPDTRDLEKIKVTCERNNWKDQVPALVPVKMLSKAEILELQLSKLPLAAAVTLGADIPSTSTTATPAPHVDDDPEASYREFPRSLHAGTMFCMCNIPPSTVLLSHPCYVFPIHAIEHT